MRLGLIVVLLVALVALSCSAPSGLGEAEAAAPAQVVFEAGRTYTCLGQGLPEFTLPVGEVVNSSWLRVGEPGVDTFVGSVPAGGLVNIDHLVFCW